MSDALQVLNAPLYEVSSGALVRAGWHLIDPARDGIEAYRNGVTA